MTYDEALRFMGLEQDATPEDVKVAYREMAQILHPDRFAENQKLQDRATEQFKQLNEARDVLLSGRGRGSRSGGSSSATSSGGASGATYSSREAQLNARINGIQAARVSLVALRDNEEDNRRNGLIMVAVGIVGALLGRRLVWIAGIATALVVWGVVKVANSMVTMKSLDAKLDDLAAQKKECVEALDSL